MSLLYKPLQNTIKSKDGSKKWRPVLVKFNRVITTKEVSKKLATISSQSQGDVYNLLCNLGDVIGDYMKNSHTVNLENLGTFTLIAKTRGNSVDTPEEVKPNQIKNLRVQFTPTITRTPGEGITRAMLTGIRYELYGSQSKMTTGETGGSGSNGSGSGDDGFIDPTE